MSVDNDENSTFAVMPTFGDTSGCASNQDEPDDPLDSGPEFSGRVADDALSLLTCQFRL